ncbi:MAG: LysR family transcriptional regulator [Anaerocolumna sp.]|jgi:DNA-binding transcriptional LysR family regulator|nr:LysR family transcriptional regulator [Anaerocolumna sp.]
MEKITKVRKENIMLDYRIETFLCVCKHMNYTKAADELKITQPGVSQHIKYLENYYGDKLFFYSNKKLTLTHTGLELRDAMISVNNDNMHLKNVIKERTTGNKLIKFGATLTIGEFFLPTKISDFLRNNPQTLIDFTIGNTKELLDLLEDGKIDFAMVEGYFKKSGYESRVISNEKYVLVCANDYPLEKVDNFKELFMHKLLLREEGSGTKEILERYLSNHGYAFSDFTSVSIINSIHVIKQLVESGYGISFLYEIAVIKELKEGKLRVVPIAEFDLYHEFNYIWRKNSAFSEFYQTIYHSLLIRKA